MQCHWYSFDGLGDLVDLISRVRLYLPMVFSAFKRYFAMLWVDAEGVEESSVQC